MKTFLLSALVLSSSAFGQTDNPCVVPAGAAPPDGCIPLLYKPADGGPERTVYLPFTPGAPVPVAKFRGRTPPAGVKLREIDVGVDASYNQPDYGPKVNIQTGVFALYTAYRFGAEAKGSYTAVSRNGLRENTLVFGPRYNVINNRHLVAYVKASFGGGHFSGDPANPTANGHTYFMQEYGGGLDYHLSRRFNVRIFDGEYQRWSSFPPNGLTPITYSSGISFRL